MAAGEALTAGSAALPARRKRSRWRSVLVISTRLLILILVGFLAMIYLLQDRLIFPGSATQGSLRRRSSAIRCRTRAPCDATRRTSHGADGPALLPDGRPHPDGPTRPALVYFYGNAMCLAFAETEFDRFRRLGLNVLIPDYLGYGLSAGKASEIGCRETAETAYQALVSRGFPRVADHRRGLVAGRSRRHRSGFATATRRADRIQHIHQHARHGFEHLPHAVAPLVFCPQV